MTLAVSPAHCDLLLALRRMEAAPRVVVIGAAALGHHVPLERTTADIDLVIVAAQERIDTLLESLDWKQDVKQRQRWRDDQNNVIDVLPGTPDVIAAGALMV